MESHGGYEGTEICTKEDLVQELQAGHLEPAISWRKHTCKTHWCLLLQNLVYKPE